MKIIHLPSYSINPYQTHLINAQKALGHDAAEGGQGGNFLRTALFHWRADVLHFHWLHPYLLRQTRVGSILRAIRFITEIVFLRLWGAKIVWTIHNLCNHDNVHVSIERFFSIIFARLCCLRIAHSGQAARMAEIHFRLQAGSVRVIPHPSYVGLCPDTVTREEARMRLNIPSDGTVLLFIGRLSVYKGITDLLEVFRDLPNNIFLVIAGESLSGELTSTLHAASQIDPRIRLFARRFDDDEVQVYFRAADISVFPYRQILTSGAVVMGMSFGSFAVVPDTPSIRETVHPHGAEFFVPNDIESLRGAIVRALKADTRRGGECNYRRACEWELSRVAAATLAAIPA